MPEDSRDTTVRSPRLQQVDGLLTADLEGRRAKYECFRPTCPQRREGPVTAAQHGADELRAFIAGIKHAHLDAFHKETQR